MSKFKLGDCVHSHKRGKGKIINFSAFLNYPLHVSFDEGVFFYNIEGVSQDNDSIKLINRVKEYFSYSTKSVVFENPTGDIKFINVVKNIKKDSIEYYNVDSDFLLELTPTNGETIIIDNNNYLTDNLVNYILKDVDIEDDVRDFFEETPFRKIEIMYILQDLYHSGYFKEDKRVINALKLIDLANEHN